MRATYDDDKQNNGYKAWEEAHGVPPWWLSWLMEEYYWLEKHKLPHGDRDAHDWEYLLALQTIDATLQKLQSDKMAKQQKDAERQSRAARQNAGKKPMKGGGFNLSGPTVIE